MAKFCPINNCKVLYLDCLECDEKLCVKGPKPKYKKLVIGIDQSYKNTGISISALTYDGKIKLLKVSSIYLEKYCNNSNKREYLFMQLKKILEKVHNKAGEVVCIIERIRLRSQGFLNIDYIKSIGALNALIVDVMSYYGIPVYSVDTRCWKAQIVGSSKPGSPDNAWNMEPEKYPTFKWLLNNYQEHVHSVFIDMTGSRKKKNVFIQNGKSWKINDDACDSAAISLFGFYGEKDKLILEK